MLGPLNVWIGDLFDRKNVDRTVAALVGSQGCGRREPNARQAMKKRLGDAESRLRCETPRCDRGRRRPGGVG